MKTILIALAFISLNVDAQKLGGKLSKNTNWITDSVKSKYTTVEFINDTDSTAQWIAVYDSNKLEIIGDTLTLIKMALIECEKIGNKYWEAKDVLDYINLDVLSRMINKKYFYEAVKEYKKSQNQTK